MRLLVAESDRALATFLERGFRAENYVVDLASDGSIALELAQEQPYDAAILDLNLPQCDGLSVLRHARASGQQFPILILSNRTRPEDRAGSRSGCRRFGAEALRVRGAFGARARAAAARLRAHPGRRAAH